MVFSDSLYENILHSVHGELLKHNMVDDIFRILVRYEKDKTGQILNCFKKFHTLNLVQAQSTLPNVCTAETLRALQVL